MTSESLHDEVNNPSHYNKGTQPTIVTIEDAIEGAQNPKVGGCHWQVLKYLLRLWYKDTPLKNALKARWYLDRLIMHLEKLA